MIILYIYEMMILGRLDLLLASLVIKNKIKKLKKFTFFICIDAERS